ncbi:MAG: nuclear transport factor 2 family protein [Haliscomenobacteraceae bacterium CHB4]|nr:nuclear transport factor 2 family protein [Haliscomenobacteraceae bacterium CHB4]
MKSTNLLLAVAVSVFSFTSCQQAPPPPAAPDLAKIRTEIQAMENAYAEAWNARNAAAVMAYYADDAVSLANNSPILTGKEAIMNDLKKQFESDTTKMTASFEVLDIFAAGDLVVETGKSTFKVASGSVALTGKYMSLFEKRDGKYVCIRDCYNNDKKE